MDIIGKMAVFLGGYGRIGVYRVKDLEREPLRYCKCDGKVTFTRPFLMLGKVTFDERVNVL